jgi:hypothetical protein
LNAAICYLFAWQSFAVMAAAVYLQQRYTSGVADCSINIEDIQ